MSSGDDIPDLPPAPPPGIEDVRDALDDAVEWGGAAENVTSLDAARAAKKATKRKARAGGEGEKAAPKGDLADEIARMNETYAVVLVGDKCLVMKEGEDEHARHRVGLMTITSFQQWFANREVGHGRSVETIADVWLRSADRRQYEGMVFKPDGAPNRFYNLWRGFAVQPAARLPNAADHIKHFATLFDHVRTNIARGDDELARWVWGWFAHIFQRPTERLGVALVLRGRQGTGKSTLGEIAGVLLGSHYSQVDDPRYLTGNFNAHMASCLLLQAEEAFWAGDKKIEGMLKGLITSSSHYIERKGYEAVKVDNYIRLLFTSNNDWVVPAGLEERRFATLDVGDGALQNHEYFACLWKELQEGGYEHLMRFLLDFDLEKVNLRSIPKTKALFDQKRSSLESPLQWWLERLEAGVTRRHAKTWEEVVTVEELFGDYQVWCEKMRWSVKTDAAFGEQLRRVAPQPPPGAKPLFRRSRRRMSVYDPDTQTTVSKNAYIYIIPPLDQCRAGFEAAIGQPIPWPEDEGETNE